MVLDYSTAFDFELQVFFAQFSCDYFGVVSTASFLHNGLLHKRSHLLTIMLSRCRVDKRSFFAVFYIGNFDRKEYALLYEIHDQ